MSKKGQAKRFVAELHRIAESTYNNMFTKQQLQQIAQDLSLAVCGCGFSFSLFWHYLLCSDVRLFCSCWLHPKPMQTGRFSEFLASLNHQGYLLQKGARTYQLQTSDF